MPEIPLYNMEGSQLGTLSLPEPVFGVEPNLALVHQAVVTEEANARQGTADTLTRGEVRGGGKKPWRQKGTGRARQGSTRAPHWRHGGVVFGPHPRSYAKDFPVKMRRGALRSALSAKVADGEVIGLDSLTLPGIGTRAFVEILERLPLKREVKTKHYEAGEDGPVRVEGTRQAPHRVLVVIPEHDPVVLRSCRNIPYVTLRYAPAFSVRDVVAAGRIVLAQGAVARIEEVLAR
ncbi:MAG: 50S ribosomal protein L4 [Chthonomonadales bacterium]|nr:50S ribosomal protein L4 [Chthonomonadales bacterium]